MSMTLRPETLKKFSAKVFIETGTNIGDCVQLALRCGFEKIVSIEKSQHYADAAKARFAGDPRVEIICGDSAEVLAEVISNISDEATFWLDAHATPGLPQSAQGFCPVLNEIEAIAGHPIKTHTILVDDVSCLSTPVLDNITVEQVKQEILKINPEYVFSFEDGKFLGDVLAARCEKTGA